MVAGRYRLLERVGRGATSTVWRACDELLDRVVAVKQLTAAQPHGLAEARITARVRHPNVAAVHDIVEQDRSYWLVMDHVAAGTLATVLRERGPLPPPVVAALGLQLLAALRAVHAAGVVHCDVKPANLLLGDDGRLALVDFGIAATGDDRIGRDDPDVVVGSPAYMAPELVRGERPRPAADLWSLGATLYAAVEADRPSHMATRRRPWQRSCSIRTRPPGSPAHYGRCWPGCSPKTPPNDPPTTPSTRCSQQPTPPRPPLPPSPHRAPAPTSTRPKP